MRIDRMFLAATLPVAFAACGGGLDVSTDYDPATDFSSYQTFYIHEDPAGGLQLDQLTQGRIVSAMTTTLSAKGLRQVTDTAQADMAFGWQITTEDKKSYQTVNTGWGGYGYGGYGGWYGGGMSMGTSTTTERSYTVGTLLLAAFDVDEKKMVFTGSGTKTINDDNLSPEESQQRINDIVGQILASYPPGS